MAALIGILEAPKRAATSRPVHVAVLVTLLAIFLLWLIYEKSYQELDSGVLDRWLLALQIPAVTLLLVATVRTWKHSEPAREVDVYESHSE